MTEPQIWVSLPESRDEEGDAWCEPDDRYGVDHRLRRVPDGAMGRMLKAAEQYVVGKDEGEPTYMLGPDDLRALFLVALGEDYNGLA